MAAVYQKGVRIPVLRRPFHGRLQRPFRAVLTRAHTHLDRGHRRALDDRREPGEELGLEEPELGRPGGLVDRDHEPRAVERDGPAVRRQRSRRPTFGQLGEHATRSGCARQRPLRLAARRRSRLVADGSRLTRSVTQQLARRVTCTHRSRDAAPAGSPPRGREERPGRPAGARAARPSASGRAR